MTNPLGPNFASISKHIDAIKDEFVLIQNIVPLTAVTLREEIHHAFNNLVAEIQAGMGEMQEEIRGIRSGRMQVEMGGTHHAGHMQEEVGAIRVDIGGMQGGMSQIREEMGVIRTEIVAMQAGMAQMQEEVGGIRAEIGAMREEFIEEFRDVQALLLMELPNAKASDAVASDELSPSIPPYC